MSLDARVAKLESIQTRVLRCPWCRFALRSRVPITIEAPVEHDVLPTKCWFCGTKYVVPLRGLNARQREVLALIYNSDPTKQFIDERVHAAGIWSYLYCSEVKEYERAKQNQTAQANQQHSTDDRAHGSGTWRDEKAKRKHEELEERALDFHQAQTERFKRLAGTSNSFPLDQALERIEQEYPTSSYDKTIDDIILGLGFEKYSQLASCLRSTLAVCNLHLQNLKKREACEVVLWGEALPETVQEIGFFEQQKQHEISERGKDKKETLAPLM